MAGCGAEDPSSEPFSEIVPVFLGLKSHQRQTEAVLATNLPVTASSIATMAGKEGDDFVHESNRSHGVLSRYRDFSFQTSLPFHDSADRGRSIFKGTQVTG